MRALSQLPNLLRLSLDFDLFHSKNLNFNFSKMNIFFSNSISAKYLEGARDLFGKEKGFQKLGFFSLNMGRSLFYCSKIKGLIRQFTKVFSEIGFGEEFNKENINSYKDILWEEVIPQNIVDELCLFGNGKQ